MVSAHYARKNGGKTKIAVRAVKAYIYLEINFADRLDGHIIIYICTGPADAWPAWPDLQTHGRTQTGGWTRRSRHRSTDADARTQKHGHGRRRTDADASARWRTNAKYSCVQCVGGKIVQTQDAQGPSRACSAWVEKSSRRVLRLNECTRTFKVYYMCLTHEYVLNSEMFLPSVYCITCLTEIAGLIQR